MKNFPNQVSNFERIRAALVVIEELNAAGEDVTSSDVLGYECARRGVYTFRGLDFESATTAQIETAIAEMKTKRGQDQGPLTFARDVRRTLRLLGWIDSAAEVTPDGDALLATTPGSVQEQAILVEGLMNIYLPDKTETYFHHPTPVLLKLLAHAPSYRRDGLELAFQPSDDSDAEFNKALAMYPLDRTERIKQMGTSKAQRANALKVLPSLCVYAGLIVQEDDYNFYLSQEGWTLLGEPATKATGAKVKRAISRRGRRTTVGKKVTSRTIAESRGSKPPRTLTQEEQERASEKLKERTDEHQALVLRMARYIGDDDGIFFEDQFSYDMLWVPNDTLRAATLFEMKTVTGDADAHARVRQAVGQLSYYEYFHVAPRLEGRAILRCVVVDDSIPEELRGYLTHERVAALIFPTEQHPSALNPFGEELLNEFSIRVDY